MAHRITAFLTVLLVGAHCAEQRFKPLSKEMIDYINNKSGALWKADHSKKFRSVEQMRRLLGVKRETPASRNRHMPTMLHENYDPFPEAFDARVHWPQCKSIGEIRDQSSCGSCWAFGAVEAMTDRMCIHSNGTFTKDLSALDLLSCCENCGHGCNGGYPCRAWDFWAEHGIVTGGSFEDKTGCAPYPFESCDHHVVGKRKPCPSTIYETPKCELKCINNSSYEGDKTYAKSVYYVESYEKNIMMEIMRNGPVEGAFDVYEDFTSYASGIYHHVTGSYVGGHAIRILGWGVEKGVPYWLIANSWNDDWGERGFFRMMKGINECGIESSIYAGLPKLS